MRRTTPFHLVAMCAALALAIGCARTGLRRWEPAGDDTGAGGGGGTGGGSTQPTSGSGGTTVSTGGGSGEGGSGAGPVVEIPPCGRGPAPDLSDPFVRLTYGFAASWAGYGTHPLDGKPKSFPVAMVFTPAETYSAECLADDPACVAFYYGTDQDSPAKTYHLEAVIDDGTGVGEIQIVFDQSGGSATGTLEAITLDDELAHLHFEFVPAWLGELGPVVYDVDCVP